MNINSSITLNSTEKSTYSLDANGSINLDDNVGLSQLDISEISIGHDATRTDEGEELQMSISLEPYEKELLRQKQRQKSKQLGVQDSTMDVEVIDEDDDTEDDEEEESVVNVDDTLLEQSTLHATEGVDEEEEEVEVESPGAAPEQQQETQYEMPPSEREFFKNDFLELGRRLWPSSLQKQHYTKGCLWSPDGTCLLLPVHLDGMHVIELPSDLYTTDALSPAAQREVSTLNSAVHVKECGTVYDCSWYPFMNSGAPETCCWLASRQHEPIHMWDAFNGELRCSYRGYDEVDEVESAISVTFSNDGQKVLGGYKKTIKVFDTNIPGRACTALPVKQAVSCFALTTDNDDTVTTGSWNGFINHYDLRVPKLGSLFTLGGHNGGVTWLRYAHGGDHWKLFSGARKDNLILQWDMRDYTKPVHTFQRKVATNQRVYFDLSPQQEWLASGDTDGLLRIWDLCSDTLQELTLPLHDDCCNGVNFHPTRPILAACSGQYHFVDNTLDEDAAKTEAEERIIDYENSLLLLWFGKNNTTEAMEV